MNFRPTLPALLCAFLAATLAAQTAVPSGGRVLLPDLVGAARLATNDANREAATCARVDVSGRGFARAVRVETTRDTGPHWAIELRAPLSGAIAAGDVALLHFHVRTIAASDETGGGQLRVALQGKEPDAPRIADTQFTVGRDWQELFVPLTFPRDFAAGDPELVFGFGYKRQTLEVGGCEVLDYGKSLAQSALPRTRFTYAGREPDAAWRKDALARIEEIRKGDVVVTVVDASGKPVSNARVAVEERRAAFQFGSALQFARLVHDTPDNLKYREKVLELFNAASPENDLKWPVWLGEWGNEFSHEQSLTALHWLRDHHYQVRGHVLVWPSWRNLPKAIGALRNTPQQADIPRLVREHIADEMGATKGLIDEWDVLNEPWDNHDLMDLFGKEIVVDWFVAARQALPDAPLYLNDYSNHDAVTDRAHAEHFEKTAAFLLEHHAPLTGLGLQAHIGSTPNAPVRVLAALDRYAKFGLPIRITEFDINTDDEELRKSIATSCCSSGARMRAARPTPRAVSRCAASTATTLRRPKSRAARSKWLSNSRPAPGRKWSSFGCREAAPVSKW